MIRIYFYLFFVQILYVFHKTDAVIEAFLKACKGLNVEATLAKSTESAIDLFQNLTTGGHHIIAVDGRHPKTIDADSFGRYLLRTQICDEKNI